MLLLPVVIHVRLGSFVGMMPSVKRVSPCDVCMMSRFFVVSALMMLSCFAMVTRGVRMVLRRLLMMLGCFLGHRQCLLCFVGVAERSHRPRVPLRTVRRGPPCILL
jgi:hypothetical protein